MALTSFSVPPPALHQPHTGETRPGKDGSWTSTSVEAHSVSLSIHVFTSLQPVTSCPAFKYFDYLLPECAYFNV